MSSKNAKSKAESKAKTLLNDACEEIADGDTFADEATNGESLGGIPYVEVGYADGSHVRITGLFDDSSFPEVAGLMTLETAPVEKQETQGSESKDKMPYDVFDTVSLEIKKLKFLSTSIQESNGDVFLNDGSVDGAVQIIDGVVNAIMSLWLVSVTKFLEL